MVRAYRTAVYASLLLICLPAFLAAGASWVEVRSPHFIILSDASVDGARDVAARFERVRAVFEKAFPKMRVYPNLPIIVLAAKDQASFEKLEPANWLKQGQLNRIGLLLRNPDKNYILLRLDAPGKNPYHTIYHEYAHLILEDDFKSIPLWLNEGLAEFYGNSDLSQKNVRLGLPSESNLNLLRSKPLLPLKTLFAVTASSPYYNEENKGNIFYAESWALTDFLMFQKLENGKGPIDRYLALVAQGAGPVDAGAEAFGSLEALQTSLTLFVHGLQFHYYRLKVAPSIRNSDLQATNMTPAESEAIRADFLLRAGRLTEGKSLLHAALEQDPQIPFANETMGLLKLREGHEQEAQMWFAKAASLSPQCYMARFYHAGAVMKQPSSNLADLNQAAQDLQDFIRFNPRFAPAYAALATLEASRLGNLDQAQQLATKASQLDAHNVHYLFLEGEILLKMGDAAGALQAAQQAIHQAASPQDKSLAYVFLGNIQEKTQALQK